MHHRGKIKGKKKSHKDNTGPAGNAQIGKRRDFKAQNCFLRTDTSAFHYVSQAKEHLSQQLLIKGYFYKPCRHVCCQSIYTARDVLTQLQQLHTNYSHTRTLFKSPCILPPRAAPMAPTADKAATSGCSII